ncbi:MULTISPECIES: ATP-binding cassette domain-containing protein [Aerococcus]|uniref:ATP-binding cassette domain-containing protein n=1 Tax=Aerococcus sanguinicola TaxID=119206 RepID=A0A5N1GGX5_9LACT|nr:MULTISPECIES: ATP-binding cassette domain-containing protein [Aerococcus]KAA9300227.1 ATP-binding cassette domain-containing protein [Aerococcus sanguinicola]MDK6369573.1 ATP-binding cassette domain-containing protein [Aerococcus sp. UMB9870]MDK6680061.1 ATP-binding cassette domain-containing protein [Aerococcus sp. UMB8608]MDK6686058.1 ATP-binding cassette domain-containing protein [Aerococcus sp. UMB8623]MDK6939838.1 ATP-binding cassette domain-containing protein [Aerococcus sp. UMB8487]
MLTLTDISYARDGRQILDKVNLQAQAGETLSINGPSGSGKSTILKIIAQLLNQDSGTVNYQGRPAQSYDYQHYRQEISYCVQNPLLFGKTVRDNFAFVAEVQQKPLDDSRIDQLKAALGLGHLADDQAVESLSGGERQRLALIRHLLFPPKILLLDEVVSSLDETSAKAVWDLVLAEVDRSDILAIWISHRPEDQKLADRSLYLVDGHLQEGGLLDGARTHD